MRPYNKRDFLRLYKILESENVEPQGMCFYKDPTWVDDIGFYTYRIDDGNTPWLIHFYINPENRSYTTLYKMYQHFKKQIQDKYKGYVVAVPDDKPYIAKFIRLAGSKEPYCHKYNQDFYYVLINKEG